MAGVNVEAGTELAQAIQSAVQPKLIENGWVAEEHDTTLSEYVTMMMVNGKDLQGVASELGGDLLGVGEDDAAVMAFAQWLFEQVQAMAAPQMKAEMGDVGEMKQEDSQPQPIPSLQDSQMDDASTPDEAIPSGPKAMRGGGRGRGRAGRIMNQLNNHMNREQLPDPLRRIKGAAGGQHGRIDSHAGGRGAPRGPRGRGAANGIQRMMNGGPGAPAAMGQMNPMMPQGAMNQLDPQQQMAFMQMMEMQATMMQQMLQQNGGQSPGFQPHGAGRGKSLFDRVDKRGGANGHFKSRSHQPSIASQNGDMSMELDSEGNKKEPFDTVCRFNTNCTNPACPYAHQSPAAPPNHTIDLTDTCSFGAACENRKCVGRHPSPAQRAQHLKQEVDCKFFPNCNNPNCPFRHPDMPPCRNGADCSVAGCRFTHSKIACRYSPCTKPHCPFKHAEGQKGVFKDKVWVPGADGVPNLEGEGGSQMGDNSNRFAGFNTNGQEELILPGKQEEAGGSANGVQQEDASANGMTVEPQIKAEVST